MSKTTKTKGLICAIFALLFLVGCTPSSEAVESISISIADQQEEYDVNTSIPVDITVEPEDADIDGLEFETSSSAVTFSEDGINTGTQEGDYEIFVKCGDVESNSLSFSVVDTAAREAQRLAEEQAALEAEAQRLAEIQAAQEAEAQRLAEERAAQEAEAQRLAEEQAAQEAEAQRLAEERAAPEAEAQRLAEEQAAQEAAAQEAAAASSASDTSPATAAGSGGGSSDMVWIPNTGSKYHRSSSCSNMKNPTQVTVDYAISLGYEPCKKCY